MRRTAALVLLGALALAGCGDSATDGDGAAASTAASVSASPPPSPSASPAAAAAPVVVTVAENDGKDAQSAVLAVRQLVYVDLATCGGCGYEWTVDTAPDAKVAAREDTAQPTAAPPSGAPMPGTPTTTRIAFRAVGGGRTVVKIGYHGPASAKADRVVVLTITVKKKGCYACAA